MNIVSESEGATRTEIMRGIREFETAAVSPNQRERTPSVVQPVNPEQSRAAPSFDGWKQLGHVRRRR